VRQAPRCKHLAISCTNRHPNRQARGPARHLQRTPTWLTILPFGLKIPGPCPVPPGQPETDGGLLADSEGRKISGPADEPDPMPTAAMTACPLRVWATSTTSRACSGFGTSSSYYLDATDYDATGQDEGTPSRRLRRPTGPEIRLRPGHQPADQRGHRLQTDGSGAEDTTSYTHNQAGDVTSIQDAEDAGTTSANHRPAVLRLQRHAGADDCLDRQRHPRTRHRPAPTPAASAAAPTCAA
jgi:hypothetical protein